MMTICECCGHEVHIDEIADGENNWCETCVDMEIRDAYNLFIDLYNAESRYGLLHWQQEETRQHMRETGRI